MSETEGRVVNENPTRQELTDALREAAQTIERLAWQVGIAPYVAQIARLRALVNNAECARNERSARTACKAETTFGTAPPNTAMRSLIRSVTFQDGATAATVPRPTVQAETWLHGSIPCQVEGCRGTIHIDAIVCGPAPHRATGQKCDSCPQTYTFEYGEPVAPVVIDGG